MIPLGVSLKKWRISSVICEFGIVSGAKGVGHYGNWVGNADGVSELDFHFGGQAGGYNVLCDVACHVASGAVHLGGVFSGESAAAVTAVAAVGVPR
jgi:hypothetical protein